MNFRPITKKRFDFWTLGATALAFALLLCSCGGTTYSCGGPSGGHCYGIVTWTGSPTGFSTEITAVPLTSGDISVDDEGWLVDYTCTNTCWVEAGEDNTNTTYANGYGTTVYFWADQTPTVGFMFYYLGPVEQADISAGNWIVYKINQDSTTSSTWNVTLSRPGGAVLYTAASTSNAMTPNTVIEGQELAGSNSAQAPLAFFSYSAVYNGSTKTLRSADGTVRADHPPNANWWSGNKPSQTSTGGLFFTDCC